MYHSTTMVFVEVPPKYGNIMVLFFVKYGLNYFSSLKNSTMVLLYFFRACAMVLLWFSCKFPQNIVNYALYCKCYFALLTNSTMILPCFRTFTMVTTMVFLEVPQNMVKWWYFFCKVLFWTISLHLRIIPCYYPVLEHLPWYYNGFLGSTLKYGKMMVLYPVNAI